MSISARPRRHRDGELTVSGVIADVTERAAAPQERATHAVVPAPTAESSSGLTPRQVEVLEMLGRGYNVPQIASQLTLSPATVKNHSRAILKTLNVHSRAAALERARALGLIWAPESTRLGARQQPGFADSPRTQ